MKVSQSSEKSREVPSAEKFPQAQKFNQKRRVNSTRVSTIMELPGVNHRWKWKHLGFQNNDLGPIQNFMEATEAQNGDCRSIQNSWISSMEMTRNGLIGKD